jgi:putative hydrolase of the HAD superfamily
MAFKAVIFDFGGVITSSPFEAFNRMEVARGLPLNFVRQVNSNNPDNNAWAKFERAEIDTAEFDVQFAQEAQALGHSLDGASVIACLAGDIRPDMVAALDQLKAGGFLLGCITNNVPAGKGAGMAGSTEKADAVEAIMARFDDVRGFGRGTSRLYLSRRPWHQLQTGCRARHGRDQGDKRSAGFARFRRAIGIDLRPR